MIIFNIKTVRSIFLLCVVISITMSAKGFAQQTDSVAPEKAKLEGQVSFNGGLTSDKGYVLGPNDVLDITFPLVPELSQQKMRVLPDGDVNVSLLGAVHVAGMTLEKAQEMVQDKLSYYLVNPKVSINLVESKPFTVKIGGQVLNPGIYELRTDTVTQNYVTNTKPEVNIVRNTPLLSNILIAAGGILYNADLEHVVIRNSLTHSETEVNLMTLLDSSDQTQDVYLGVGDSVYVPKVPNATATVPKNYKLFASATFAQRKVPVRVLGYVNNPGLIQLDSSQSLNLNSAIASAGGYLMNSQLSTPEPPRKVYISRQGEDGHLIVKTVNPKTDDVALLPNDIVYVPDKTRASVGKAFDYMNRLVSPASNFANGYNNWALMFNPTRYQIRVTN